MASAEELERFGRYVLLHRIAMGGMAEIFLALPAGKSEEKDLLVIKRIREDLCTDETFTEMFIDEARVVSRLSHPNIIKMHEFGEVDGVYFIALEHVWGESLRTLTLLCTKAQMRFPMGAALYIAIETAKALDYAHHNRDESGEISPVIHRDVTLGNVVISYDGDVKVLDFGIAKAKGRMSQTRAGQVKGTLAYLAPEQLAGGEMGPHTDIYQLGVLMYQTLVGRLPVQAESEGAMMGAIVAGNIVKPSDAVPGFPPRIEQVLLKAMARKPDQRFASAAELASTLGDLLRGTSYEGGRDRVAHMVNNITGDRKQRQIGMIKELLHGAAFDDESTDLFRWAAVDDAPQQLNVELSGIQDQGELDDFEEAPTIVMPPSELQGEIQAEPVHEMRLADADYQPLRHVEPTVPAIPLASPQAAAKQPLLLEEEEYDDAPPTLAVDVVVPDAAKRPDQRAAPDLLDPEELIPIAQPTPVPARDGIASFGLADTSVGDDPSVGHHEMEREAVSSDVFANSNMAADDFDAILGIRDQQPPPADEDIFAVPQAPGGLRPALRSGQPNVDRPMPLIKESPASPAIPETRLSASDLFADIGGHERDPDSIGQHPLWDPSAIASGAEANADIHSETTGPIDGQLTLDEIPSALKPRAKSQRQRRLLLLSAPILGVLGGFLLLAFVIAPELGQRLLGFDPERAATVDAGAKIPVVVAPTDAGSKRPDRSGGAIKRVRDAAAPRDKAAPRDAAEPPDTAATSDAAAAAAKSDTGRPPTLRPGFLTITSQVPILVDIDGKPMGQTPLYNVELPQGEHTVDLWRNPVTPKRTKVTIHPGEVTTLAE
ncbi:MAG: serine/threonine protein kinase [Deltaproteobacteria bacterium]|nr:serine/threonine protein kinase [Deltaproteobacteria bacterium]